MWSHIVTLIKAAQPGSGILLATATALIGHVLRYLFIEPSANGAACEIDGPWWCPPRTILIAATEWNVIGSVALALALVTILMVFLKRRTEGMAMAAMAVGGAGLWLYNATFSAIAVVLAGLVLAREQQQKC